jgi:hypothetical protein
MNADLCKKTIKTTIISLQINIAKEFSDIVTYCVSRKFVSFKECEKKCKFFKFKLKSFDKLI